MSVQTRRESTSRRRSLPASRGRRLARSELVQRIDRAEEPLLLMTAPSGYGKTNLLAEWGAATSTEVAWLTCESADRDPSHFSVRLTETIRSCWPGAGSDAALIVGRATWHEADLVAALAKDLADVPGAKAIVIDDCHLAESSHRMLSALARQLPPDLRMLMAGQHAPRFSTARMRIEGVIAELRAADIAFTATQADELLQLAGLELAPDDARRLHELTEGWPAGLQMALLAMRKAPDPRDVVEAFAASTNDTSDYLANEVIAGLSPEMTEFMTTISVLDEFDADLCEALTGQADANILLRRIVDDDLFIYQLDVAGERFRFHQMFAAFLRSRLKAQGRETFRAVHGRAAEALLLQGDRIGALRHAMLAEDLQRAITIVGLSVAQVLDVDDARQAMAVARAWLARLGDDAARDTPELFLEVVLLLASCGQGDTERWLLSFDQLHPEPPPRVAALAHGAWGAFHNNRGNAELALVHNARAELAAARAAAEGPMFPKLAELRTQAVGAHLLLGDVGAATAALDNHAVPWSLTIVEDVGVPAIRQFVAFIQGDLTAVDALSDHILRGAAEHQTAAHSAGMIVGTLARAGAHIERGEYESAATLLAIAHHNAQVNGRPLIQTFVDRWLAHLFTATGDQNGAAAAITHARLIFAAPSEAVLAELAREDFRILVTLAPDRADPLISALHPSTATSLLLAKLAVTRSEWSAALEILAGVEPENVRQTIEWHVLSSLANQNRDLAAAHQHLHAAVTVARPHRYLMTIARSGHGIADLIRSMPTPPGFAGYLDELLAATNTHRSHSTQPLRRSATDLLTGRELEVLRLLSTRLTTNEIAATLFVSANTLKTHMRSIYQKLLVNSRADAVAQAQAQGMI